MTLTDWNKRPDLQEKLNDFLASDAGIALDSVLRNSAPRLNRGQVVDAVTASIELGRINQHFVPIDLMQAMRKDMATAAEPLVADYSER